MVFAYNIRKSIDVSKTDIDLPSLENPILKNSVPPFEDPPNLVWVKTYEGDFNFLQQTSDNGYILAGGIYTSKWNVYLMKIDIDGNEEWDKTFVVTGGPYSKSGCVKETADGGYIVSGYIDVGPEMSDIWLIKTDENGTLLWDKTFRFEGSTRSDAWDDGVIVLDDGYIILAELHYFDHHDIWLIKTDLDGNELWSKTVGSIFGKDWPSAFIEDSDGNFVITGSLYSLDLPNKVLLIKTDSNGNRIWRKTLIGERGHDIKECDDGGYIISDALHLIKTDKDGNQSWRKYYDWGLGIKSSVALASDGGYILVGAGVSDITSIQSYVMIKTDKDGNREWERTIVNDGGYNNCVIQSNDGNYVANWHEEVVKVSPFDNQRPNKPSTPNGPKYVKPRVFYDYTSSSWDSDGEAVCYLWEAKYCYDFLDFQLNNETCEVSFGWLLIGQDVLKVKARDIYGGDSEWAKLDVRITWSKTMSSSFLLRFLERYPLLNRLLNFKNKF